MTVFTQVSDVEAVRALAVKRDRQQAALAELGLAALGPLALEPFAGDSAAAASDLYQRALDVFAETLGCERGFVIERGQDSNDCLVRAVRQLPSLDRSAVLPDFVAAHLQTVLAVGGASTLSPPGQEQASAPSFADIKITSGIACPLRLGASVYGMLTVYSENDRQFSPEDLHFAQSIANVVAGTLCRQRSSRRLSLEHAVGQAVADADSVAAMAPRLAAALLTTLGAFRVQLWLPEDGQPELSFKRVWPEPSASETHAAPALPGLELRQAFATSSAVSRSMPVDGRTGTELVFPVLFGNKSAGMVRCCCRARIVLDEQLLAGLARAGRAIGECLHWMRIDQALRESERRYRVQSAELEAIYGALPVGLSIHDRDLRPLRVNRRLRELRASVHTPLAEALLRQVVERGESVCDVELTGESATGLSAWLCNFAPVKDAEGEVVAVSSVVQDITERKRIEEALREADRQKDEFLAILGHELRNPLGALRNATELLGVIGHGSPEVSRIHGVLARQTAQMATLLDGLLDVSRIMRDKLALDKSVTDVCQLLKDVVQDRATLLEQRHVALELCLPDEPLWVSGDAVRLIQVFDNLLSNAAKFTCQGGHILVLAEKQHGRVRISVEDDGIGIEQSLLPHIFEPFRQAQQASDRSLGGLGLGLSLARGLVELHGGTVSAKSQGPGQGSRFLIELEQAQQPGRASAPAAARVTPLRVLVVEDNADMAEMLSELLAITGHQVVALASNGRQGVERAFALRPDVLLCDIGLPGELDGLDVARIIRAQSGPLAPHLIAVTGYGSADYRKRAKDAGFDYCLIKPVSLDRLQTHLQRAACELGQPSYVG